jgi:3-oxoacyl-[acyl-carrier protein] reductase
LPFSIRFIVQVVVHDSNTADLEDVLRELGDLSGAEKCYPISFDPSDPENVDLAIARIQAEFHPVYILINNNAVISNTLIAETSFEDWRKSFSQNVDSAFLVARALLPAMRKRKWGRIVNTCSLAGKTGGITTGIAYSTTKGALQTLTFALAREVAKDGITVNGIAPAYIRHPTVSTYPKEMIDMLLRYIPVGRLCEPEEFAFTVKFLISPLSGFICGEIVDQNGGLLMS